MSKKRKRETIDLTTERKECVDIIAELPADVFTIILPFCSLQTQLAFALVCKEANRLSIELNSLSRAFKTLKGMSRPGYVVRESIVINNIHSLLEREFEFEQRRMQDSIVSRYPAFQKIFAISPLQSEQRNHQVCFVRNNSRIRFQVCAQFNDAYLIANYHMSKSTVLFMSSFNIDDRIHINRMPALLKMLDYMGLTQAHWTELLDLILSLVYSTTRGILPLEFKTKFSGNWNEKYTWGGECMLPEGYSPWNWMRGYHRDLCVDNLFKEIPRHILENHAMVYDVESSDSDYVNGGM